MWLALLAACTSGEGDSAPPGPGALGLTFRMDADYLEAMSEPATGTFRGSVYAEADASSIGPTEGASSLLDFQVVGLDLSDGGGPSTTPYVTDPLEPQVVWVLGCLDTAGDDCEQGDPITIPNENKVEVLADDPTAFEVYLGMLHP